MGKPVDRPAVNFYEIGGFSVNPFDDNKYNVYNSLDWQPLLELAETKTDLMRFANAKMIPKYPDLRNNILKIESYEEADSCYNTITYNTKKGILTEITRRDIDTDTVWHVKHLLENTDDVNAYLSIPNEFFEMKYDISHVDKLEQELGDRGVVMFDSGDPLCVSAGLFSMADYTVFALTEPNLFHELIEKSSIHIYDNINQTTRKKKGHIWRICGPEYATAPYLPPRLFKEYVCKYDKKIIDIIHKSGGFVRLHCHGNIKDVLHMMIDMDIDGLDPIEPPNQGDVELSFVRREYGKYICLFGNIEASNIEYMPNEDFEKLVRKAVQDGICGEGRGFVLQPTASPYGRHISKTVLKNYEIMIEIVNEMRI